MEEQIKSSLLIKTSVEDVVCSSSRHLEGIPWRRLVHVFSVTIFGLLRRLWRRKNVALKTYLKDGLNACLEDVSKTSCRETKGLLGISVSNKSKCVSKIFIFHKSISCETKANPKCINFSPIISIFVLIWNSSSIFILRIKMSDNCSVLWNHLNSNSTLQSR